MKPLARWTVGKVTNTGMEILRESVRVFGRIYPEFDRVVCYNNVERPAGFDGLYEQMATDLPYPLLGPDADPGEGGSPASGWKLCPPRLRPEAHELWLDNDIVV